MKIWVDRPRILQNGCTVMQISRKGLKEAHFIKSAVMAHRRHLCAIHLGINNLHYIKYLSKDHRRVESNRLLQLKNQYLAFQSGNLLKDYWDSGLQSLHQLTSLILAYLPFFGKLSVQFPKTQYSVKQYGIQPTLLGWFL